MPLKSIVTLLAVLLTVTLSQLAVAQNPPPETDKEKLSYGVGVEFGRVMEHSDDRLDFDALIRGMVDAMSGAELAMSDEDIVAATSEFRRFVEKDKQEALVRKGREFLDSKAKEEGVVVLPSGLQYKIVRPGTGAMPKATDTVETHYRGTFADGKEFDSSYKRDAPASFPVNRVISGWTEALQLMKVGAKWELYIPYDLAYGAAGRAGIPAYSTLIFELELLGINK